MPVTRRRFIQTTMSSSVLALSSFDPQMLWAEARQSGRGSSPFTAVQREILAAAADEIIPAGDGQPSAGEIGAIDYIEVLCGKAPEIADSVRLATDRIEAISTTRFRRPFVQVAAAGRVRILQTFERESLRTGAGESLYGSSGTNLFGLLRDLVYEAYYTNPKSWPALGYEFHPTHRRGPDMKPFDQTVLARMKRQPKSWREVK